jgi:hypothetical protein
VKACRIAVVFFVLTGLAACVTSTNPTLAAADRLARSAEAFATTACPPAHAVCSDARYLTTAERFTEQALDFRETADGGTPLQILNSYEHLWREYHKLRYQVSRSSDAPGAEDFALTTRAFRDVQQCVKLWYSQADHALLSRGGYGFDPYYN